VNDRLSEMIKTSKLLNAVHFGIVLDPDQSRYLDPFPDPDWNSGWLWFCIKDWGQIASTLL